MRNVFVWLSMCILLANCTLRVGTVDETDPNYYRPGVVVGTFQITETADYRPRFAIMTCTNEGNLYRQLDRVLPVNAITRLTAREIRGNQVSHLRGWGCNERVVRGRPYFQWVGSYTSSFGQRFSVYRVWQRDGRIARAFNFGLTAW